MKNKPVLVLTACIGIVAVIGGILIGFLLSKDRNKPGNGSAETSAAIDALSPTDAEKEESTDSDTVVPESEPSTLVPFSEPVRDDGLFSVSYKQVNRDQSVERSIVAIYRDGTEKTILNLADHGFREVEDLKYYHGEIYAGISSFQKNEGTVISGIYVIDIDDIDQNRPPRKICDIPGIVASFALYRDLIFYTVIAGDGIYCYNMTDRSTTKIAGFDNHSLLVDDQRGMLYYSNVDLYEYEIATGTATLLFSDSVPQTISEDRLIFSNDGFYVFDLNKRTFEKICEEPHYGSVGENTCIRYHNAYWYIVGDDEHLFSLVKKEDDGTVTTVIPGLDLTYYIDFFPDDVYWLEQNGMVPASYRYDAKTGKMEQTEYYTEYRFTTLLSQ